MHLHTNLKEFIKYTTLNVLGMIGISCYILADTFFISKGLGTNGLAALNLAIPIYSLIHGSGLMLGMGGATRYSITKEQKNSKNSDLIFTNTIYMGILLSVFFLLIGFFFSEQLTKLLQAEGNVFSMTKTYLSVILLFSPAFIYNNIFICFVRNDGNPRLAMFAMLGGSFANIFMDYLFIFPLHMGILGAVLATATAPIISMIILSYHWIKKCHQFHFIQTIPQFSNMTTTLFIGFPSLITEVSSGIVILIFNLILLQISGNVGVAAYGVIANLSLVVISIFTGIAQGIQPIISSAYGKGKKEHLLQTLRYGTITVFFLSVLIYIGMFFFADSITNLFNRDSDVQLQQIAVTGIHFYFIGVLFVGYNIILSSFFASIEKALPAHFISVMRGFLLIIPLAFLLSKWFGIIGVWIAFPITEGLCFIIGKIFYYKINLY